MIIALDLGKIHIGLAVAEGTSFAMARSEILRKDLITELKKIKKEDNLEKIIIGLPLTLSGKESHQARITRDEGREIEKKIGVKVEFLDERLTTAEAQKSGLSHSEAARLILESYLKKSNLS